MKCLRLGIIVVFVPIILALLICSCGGSNTGTVVDYGDAAAFEEALNRGENLENKTLMFTVTELHPDSTLGFNVCGGEHLNFISSRNPDLKVGDTAGVKATEISNLLGSWIIKYELISNPVIGETTIVSAGQDSQSAGQNQDTSTSNEETENTSEVTQDDTGVPGSPDADNEAAGVETDAETGTETESPQDETQDEAQEQSTLEIVDSNIVAFNDYFGSPAVSAYVAFKNISDSYIGINNARIDYNDNDGKLLATDQFANCIPEVVKPGQVFYLYSYHFDISGIDTSNGLRFVPDGKIYEANNFFEIDVSDISFSTGSIMDVSVIGRATNNTGANRYGKPGAVFYDNENNVVGFCYGLESFEAGETRSFEISGSMMSEDYDPSVVDHVEVFIQGGTSY